MLEKKNILDLSDKIKQQMNAQLIFNDDCEMETNAGYTEVKLSETEKLLVFLLEQDCGIESVIDNNKNYSTISIKMKPFRDYIKAVPAFQNIEDKYQSIYLRFRVKGIALKDILFFDSEQTNKSFESAFSATRVLDFKINQSRNIENVLRVGMNRNGYEMVKFSKVHFLIMLPSAYDLDQYSGNINCRELESGVWNDYFGQDIDFHKGHVLAYHWKRSAKESASTFEEFSCFAKINYRKTKPKMLMAYIIIVISLGMTGSALVSLCQNVYNFFMTNSQTDFGLIIALALGILMFLVGLSIGRSES